MNQLQIIKEIERVTEKANQALIERDERLLETHLSTCYSLLDLIEDDKTRIDLAFRIMLIEEYDEEEI